MNGNDIARRAKGASYIIAINCAVFAALFLLVELVMHSYGLTQILCLGPRLLRASSGSRIPFMAIPFDRIMKAMSIKDATSREVPLRPDRKRVLFVGDSFTDGVGVPYEEPFVGRFGSAFPNLDVLNAG